MLGEQIRARLHNGASTYGTHVTLMSNATVATPCVVYGKAGAAYVHLNTGVVVILDTAAVPKPCDIALRWHTANKSQPDSEGRFLVKGYDSGAQLASRVARVHEEGFGDQ